MKLSLGIYDKVNQGILNRVETKHRDYLGASLLGEQCSRKLWYMFKFPMTVDSPKLQRIFDLGHILEDYMIKLLRDAGLTVWDRDEDGNQFGFREGKIAGHADGVCIGLPESSAPHLAEYKTANSKRFKSFAEKGCEATEIKYWVQCHIYMLKLGLEDCLFMVLNKDNQDLYFERIKLDKKLAEMYLERGQEIVEAVEAPERKYSKSTDFRCRWCDHHARCWK